MQRSASSAWETWAGSTLPRWLQQVGSELLIRALLQLDERRKVCRRIMALTIIPLFIEQGQCL